VFWGTGYWIAWNTDLVDEPITSYENLVSRADEFRGQLGVPDWLGSTIPLWYMRLEETMSDTDLTTDLTPEGELPGGFLPRLGELDPVYRESAQPLTQALAAGEVKAVIFTTSAIINELKEAGAPV